MDISGKCPFSKTSKDTWVTGCIFPQGQPPTAGAGCAEPREEVSTQTEELPREPWELGCGHAVTLQHFHHVIVAVGLDHAYSRRCAMLKALTSHAGPGHAFDVAVPLWLSISKALTAKALTAKALTAKSLTARAGLGDIVDVGAPPHISTPAMNSQVHDGHIVVTLTETSQDADHVSFTDNPHATLAGTSQIADHIGSEDNPHATLAGTSQIADHIGSEDNPHATLAGTIRDADHVSSEDLTFVTILYLGEDTSWPKKVEGVQMFQDSCGCFNLAVGYFRIYVSSQLNP